MTLARDQLQRQRVIIPAVARAHQAVNRFVAFAREKHQQAPFDVRATTFDERRKRGQPEQRRGSVERHDVVFARLVESRLQLLAQKLGNSVCSGN